MYDLDDRELGYNVVNDQRTYKCYMYSCSL